MSSTYTCVCNQCRAHELHLRTPGRHVRMHRVISCTLLKCQHAGLRRMTGLLRTSSVKTTARYLPLGDRKNTPLISRHRGGTRVVSRQSHPTQKTHILMHGNPLHPSSGAKPVIAHSIIIISSHNRPVHVLLAGWTNQDRHIKPTLQTPFCACCQCRACNVSERPNLSWGSKLHHHRRLK